jgi:hypothetical protein
VRQESIRLNDLINRLLMRGNGVIVTQSARSLYPSELPHENTSYFDKYVVSCKNFTSPCLKKLSVLEGSEALMSKQSRQELVLIFASNYQSAKGIDQEIILDEFVSSTGYNNYIHAQCEE